MSLLQNSLKTTALTLLCGGAILAGIGNAAAEVSFKGKTIDVIMGSAPGGGTDGMTRLVGGAATLSPLRRSHAHQVSDHMYLYHLAKVARGLACVNGMPLKSIRSTGLEGTRWNRRAGNLFGRSGE